MQEQIGQYLEWSGKIRRKRVCNELQKILKGEKLIRLKWFIDYR